MSSVFRNILGMLVSEHRPDLDLTPFGFIHVVVCE